MGKSSANISRNMYDEAKRYQMLVHQQGVPWVEADENDRNWIFYNLLRRFIQKMIGNGSPDDGFKVMGTGAANDFVITGGDGTVEGASRLLVEGFQCVLPESRNYRGTDNLECTPISTGLSETVLTDSAANFTPAGPDNNLAGRTLAPDITKPDKVYTITENTQTTITVSGNILADGIQAGAHYRVELSTPTADRTDEIYIDCYLDEIDSNEDPELKHTLGIQLETQRRLKLIQNVLVAEGSSTPAPYTDSDGNQHYTLKLATIQRYGGQDTINSQDVIDKRSLIYQGLRDLLKANKGRLTQLLHPSENGGWSDIYKSGWKPWCLNQRWGGVQWGQLPDGSWGDITGGYIENDSFGSRGTGANNTWSAQAFKVSEAITVQAVWMKLYKAGNPQKDTEPIEVGIASSLDNGSGVTWVANGVCDKINGVPLSGSGNFPITSSSNGQWYRFIFTTNPTLLADTTYYLVFKTPGQNPSNYLRHALKNSPNYPFGKTWVGDDPTPSNWSESTEATAFLIEAENSDQFLQKNGRFGAKLVFAEGNPLSQSKALTQPLKNFFDDREFTCLFRGSGITADKTFMDFIWGLDHDRIVVRCNASGYPQVELYEADGTRHTVTGTTNISDGNSYDIAIKARMREDGSDYLYLYVNGAINGTPLTSQSFVVDAGFKELGTAWLGGGFPLAPTWSDEQDMSSLPSADPSWAWVGSGVEADCMSIQNGKLHQNKNGYGNSDNGFYEKGSADFDNSKGWVVTWKCRVKDNKNINSPGKACCISIADGTKSLDPAIIQEYCVETDYLETDLEYQTDFRESEHIFLVLGKGADFYLFIDGKLAFEGTGLMINASALNKMAFGDNDTFSGSKADVVWDYFKHYVDSALFPEFTGATLDEFAFWSGDRSTLLSSLYNEGAFISVKDYCGVNKNYVQRIEETKMVRDFDSYSSTSNTPIVIKEKYKLILIVPDTILDLDTRFTGFNAINAQVYQTTRVNGEELDYGQSIIESQNAEYTTISANHKQRVRAGLCVITSHNHVPAGTGYWWRRIKSVREVLEA